MKEFFLRDFRHFESVKNLVMHSASVRLRQCSQVVGVGDIHAYGRRQPITTTYIYLQHQIVCANSLVDISTKVPRWTPLRYV